MRITSPLDSADDDLRPNDAPILLASMIAARRTGDDLLEEVCERELRQLGLRILFLSNFALEARRGR